MYLYQVIIEDILLQMCSLLYFESLMQKILVTSRNYLSICIYIVEPLQVHSIEQSKDANILQDVYLYGSPRLWHI